ncbi:MAG: hypothetical protein J3K34DRAFT_504855 [Monoraphidium minutum]|nr:MAG: hypothetical protein J3K34DRAFT_504855 [Monoraphidium minutum]
MSLQSHASRHALVSLLSQPHLPRGDRVVVLQVLNTLLANQETKSEAIAAGAPGALAGLMLGVGRGGGGGEAAASGEGEAGGGGGGDGEASGGDGAEGGGGEGDDPGYALQQALCCRALESLCLLPQGRAAAVDSAGLHALTAALGSAPEAAAAALRALTGAADGITHLQRSPARVVASLVDALGRPATPLPACRDAAAVLAGAASTDAGVIEACASQVPAAVVALARRVLRFRLDATEGGGGAEGGEGLLAGVLREACGCMRALCHHADGKTQVREAGGIEALAAVLTAAGAGAALHGLVASALALIAVDAAAKGPVMAHAGAALVGLLKAAAAAGAAAAALRLALEAPGARRRLEALLTPQERAALLGRLPDTPPAYRFVLTPPPAAQ